ncbi:MAG: T9SS type A sorting domain-containing protein [Bacteroidota bacterium]
MSLGCTNDNALSTATGWLPTQQVFGPQNITTNNGWYTFNIAGYDWDGASNIVIEACYNNTNGTTIGSDNVQYTSAVGYTATMRAYTNTNGSNGCTLAPSFSYTSRPNVRFRVCPPPPPAFTYNWSPSTGLSCTNCPNPTINSYPGGNMTYTVTVGGGNCTVIDTVALSDCVPLPADNLYLTAEAVESGVALNWLTQNEENTSYFELERSTDGQEFTVLNTQPASGFANGELRYDHLDGQPLVGRNIYRVKLYDLDGAFAYSNAVEVTFQDGAGVVRLYPNPAQESQSMFLEYFSTQNGPVTLEWVDVLGKVLKTDRHELAPGMQTLELNTSQLAAGTYFLKVSGPHHVDTRKVLIIR